MDFPRSVGMVEEVHRVCAKWYILKMNHYLLFSVETEAVC